MADRRGTGGALARFLMISVSTDNIAGRRCSQVVLVNQGTRLEYYAYWLTLDDRRRDSE